LILLSLALLGFAAADLLRWSPEPVSARRTLLSTIGATAVTLALAGLGGLQTLDIALIGAITVVVLTVWLLFDQPKLGRYPLAWILVVLPGAFAASGLTDTISGPLERWYSALPFAFARSVSIDQFPQQRRPAPGHGRSGHRVLPDRDVLQPASLGGAGHAHIRRSMISGRI
jgi:hypothetical protein